MHICKAINCRNTRNQYDDFCTQCSASRMAHQQYAAQTQFQFAELSPGLERRGQPVKLNPPVIKTESMSSKYPKYYKSVGELKEVDVYAVHMLFEVDDPSGALQHASKKLLLSGARTGGKSAFDDVREARDTLNRWLELNAP